MSLLNKKQPKRFDLTDRDGLSIRVSQHGIITFQYRYIFNDKPVRLSIGRFPDFTLSEARDKVPTLRKYLAEGKDPAVELNRFNQQNKLLLDQCLELFLTKYVTKLRPAIPAKNTIDIYQIKTIILFICTVFCMYVIPIYIEAGITGFESPAAEYKELGLSLDQLLIKHPNATFIGLASGRSMEKIGIFDRDLLIVDRAEPVNHGSIIVANYNGCFVCKILDKQQKRLVSASDEYMPVLLTAADEFQLEGVVTHSIRQHTPCERFLQHVCFS